MPKGCGCSSGIEHDLAKVGVEGSNPFARSKNSFDYRGVWPVCKSASGNNRRNETRSPHTNAGIPENFVRELFEESRSSPPTDRTDCLSSGNPELGLQGLDHACDHEPVDVHVGSKLNLALAVHQTSDDCAHRRRRARPEPTRFKNFWRA